MKNNNLSPIISALLLLLAISCGARESAADNLIANQQKEGKESVVFEGDSHPSPCLSWINPSVKPRLALLCIHGLGLNSDAYSNFGVRMARRGIATYAIDVRGFGSWMRAQGHEQVDFVACLGDIKATLQSIRSANPGLPLFILGESMGGAIALRAASIYPDLVDGLVSSVPAGERFQQKKTDLKVALDFLKGPHKQFDIGKQIVDQATDNEPTLREDWQSDPLNRMDLSADQLIQFQNFMNDNHEAAKKIGSMPVMLLQGTLDTLVKPEGTWEIFNELKTKQKTFIALPSEHLVLEEGQAKTARYDARAAQLVAGWLYACLPDADVAAVASAPAVPDDSSTSTAQSNAVSVLSAVTNTANALPNVGTSSDITGGVATVLIFEAPWCEECKGMDQQVLRARQIFGKQVKFRSVNIDDSASVSLAKSFNVGPIPTCVFLKADGSTASMQIGRASFANFVSGVQSVLR